MKRSTEPLRPGDLVEVKTPGEIVATLDAAGTLDRLPFMPEMVEFCGKRFQVSKRVVKTCYYGLGSGMRKFEPDDVVLLQNVRCSGAHHDGCQKGCAIFWREAWLKRVEPEDIPVQRPTENSEKLRFGLKTSTSPGIYFCQASEILNATEPLTRWERLAKCASEVYAGNCTALEMANRMAVWTFWKIRRVFRGAYARGTQTSTPAEALHLQPGDRVEIKSIPHISATLNQRAHNRGLYFTPAMGALCGEQHQVERRLEKIIVDGTGEMRKMRNTVYLKGSLCGCSCVAFGGCPRTEFAYWREIWLNRLGPGGSLPQSGD